MHILDQDSDKVLESVILYLTCAEAHELRDSLNSLLKKPLDNHAHVSDDNYQNELTVCIYDINNLKGFDKRSISIIMTGK